MTTLTGNCIDCEHHKVIPDPDLSDWFCHDDVAVVCTLAINPKQDVNSDHVANRQSKKLVTVACRPYQVRAESVTPGWCPLQPIQFTPIPAYRNDRK